MAARLTLRISELVGSGLCVASDDGQKVHDQIAHALRDGRKVQLSFLNVETLSPTFLNAAIGQLYAGFSESAIRNSLSVADMAREDMFLLKRVVDNAKAYFKDPTRFAKARAAALEEAADETL